MSADPTVELRSAMVDAACREMVAILDRQIFLPRPASLDDLDVDQRLVTAQLAAERLGRARRTIARWISAGRVHPVACLVGDRSLVYRETDILLAERDARQDRARHALNGPV